jgi:hypothetical protein
MLLDRGSSSPSQKERPTTARACPTCTIVANLSPLFVLDGGFGAAERRSQVEWNDGRCFRGGCLSITRSGIWLLLLASSGTNSTSVALFSWQRRSKYVSRDIYITAFEKVWEQQISLDCPYSTVCFSFVGPGDSAYPGTRYVIVDKFVSVLSTIMVAWSRINREKSNAAKVVSTRINWCQCSASARSTTHADQYVWHPASRSVQTASCWPKNLIIAPHAPH